MLAVPHPWNAVSEGYEATTMGYLSRYSKRALQEVSLTKNAVVLDLACGPGTLTRMVAPYVAHVDALDFSPNMIALLDVYLAENAILNVETRVGDGQDLPYRSDRYDAVFSMFGLMFFPDRMAGFSELWRVLKPGGTMVVSSWAPVAQSPGMRLMFGAICAMQPDLPESPARVLDSLDNPVVFQREMAEAGFAINRVVMVTHEMTAGSVDDFWDNLLRGSVPLVMLREQVGEDAWPEMAARGKAYLQEQLGDGPVSLSSDAWLGIGVK
jgi:ubiquinone/menaquinone biosynthesis C-methylase UbiE